MDRAGAAERGEGVDCAAGSGRGGAGCSLAGEGGTVLPPLDRYHPGSTFNLTALRWLYIPSFGICLLAALAVWKLVDGRRDERSVSPRVGYAALALLVLAWGFGVIYENRLWYKSGEEARSILAEIKEQVRNTTEPVTIYFAHAPQDYDTALLFNTGLAAGVSLTNEGRRIELHEMEQPIPDGVVVEALADPPKLRPNAVFLGYKEGKVISYPSVSDLMRAHPLKR